jgi:DNA polymerase
MNRAQVLAELGITQWVLRDTAEPVLDELDKTIAACRKCGTNLNSGTSPLVGAGVVDAKIMVISDHLVAGQLFSKPAQILYHNMLKAVGLESQNIYITTAVKCQVSKPEDALGNCQGYLSQQIRVVKPELVLCLGSMATSALLRLKDKVSNLRGLHYINDSLPILVSFHPEFLLHKPSSKKQVWQDLLKLKNLLKVSAH